MEQTNSMSKVKEVQFKKFPDDDKLGVVDFATQVLYWKRDTAEKLQKLNKGGEAFLKELGDKICSECPFYMVTKELLESLKDE